MLVKVFRTCRSMSGTLMLIFLLPLHTRLGYCLVQWNISFRHVYKVKEITMLQMCGPTGVGFLYGKSDILSTMPPFLGKLLLEPRVVYVHRPTKKVVWNDTFKLVLMFCFAFHRWRRNDLWCIFGSFHICRTSIKVG